MNVVFRPQAEDDLFNLYSYISAESGSADLAFDFVWRLREACLGLGDYPSRGVPRDDVVRNQRILVFEKRGVIAYFVTKSAVEIAAIFHGGQDWVNRLQRD